MKYVAIIPARGGSKGIPRKNVRLLSEKPLIQYSIEQAAASPRISEVYVSTDDREIARVSRDCGASVIMRPAEIASDFATSESALLHSVDEIVSRVGEQPESIVFMQCTSPLRAIDDIDNAITLYENEKADSLLSVVESHCFFWQERDGSMSATNYDYLNRPRRQDKEPELMETGSFYIFDTMKFMKAKNRLFGKIVGYRMSPATAFEIDEEHDLVIVEALIEDWKRKGLLK